MNALLDRIVAASGVPDLVDILAARLSPTDLQSLLLEVYDRRSSARSPADLLADYEKSRFFGAASLTPADAAEWDAVLSTSAGDCQFLTLSPMAPLGACAVVAPVGQSWSVPTVRTGEVVSDATNVLAIEAALLRRAAAKRDPKSQEIVHLATTHRVVRPQAYAKPGLLAHFALSAMVSAGRDRGSLGFEAAALHAQIGAWLTAYRRYFGPKLRLGISYTLPRPGNPDARLEALRALAEAHNAELIEDAERSAANGYYAGFCFHLLGGWPDGELRQLADGGMVDWTAKLLGNAKERLLISGCGVEGLVALRGQGASV
ncbi:MAG TPA: hypothetical protein VN155_11335 [Devosia sp.]|nr:hypothetical protein [Devosia sp.]